MSDQPKRLLILACSQRKRLDSQPLPALERYDGPAFRVLRKFLHEFPQAGQTIALTILSAEYGLIPADQLILNYNRQMTTQRARELRPDALKALECALESDNHQRIFIGASKGYMETLIGYEQLVGTRNVVVSSGTQGRRLTDLHDWLRDGSPMLAPKHPKPVRRGLVRLRGIEIALTADQVLDVARKALAEGRGNPDAYQSWYIDVNGRRVGVKWVVSQVTGLPVDAFVTDEARRVLEQLSIPLRRI